MSKIILITGASTGFGHDTAETLARAGHTVFASMCDPHGKSFESRSQPDACPGIWSAIAGH
jgi:NAD(P)-dependent dehydrogenase (short-subunit alcohol dehydrogenase family)